MEDVNDKDLLEVLEDDMEDLHDYDIESAHASSEDLERHISPARKTAKAATKKPQPKKRAASANKTTGKRKTEFDKYRGVFFGDKDEFRRSSAYKDFE